MPNGSYRYDQMSHKRSNKWAYIFVAIVIIAVALTQISIFGDAEQTSRVVDDSSIVHELNLDLPRPDVSPDWPEQVQSAVGAIGYGVLAESDVNAQPVPMASLAKIMAAILIIEQDVISVDNPGRDIVFNLEDEAYYNKYLFDGGVVTTVKAGESITQREALDAMLIISSNNIADTAVVATFGSIEKYLEAANNKAAELGLENTHFDDVTGFSPQSVSTASELLVLAEYAMQDPLFAEIVATWQKTILEDVELTSSNTFLDFENNGVIGVKSGLTDEAGGTYIAAARYTTEDGDNIIALAVTLGAETHFQAQEVTMPLLRSVKDSFNQP